MSDYDEFIAREIARRTARLAARNPTRGPRKPRPLTPAQETRLNAFLDDVRARGGVVIDVSAAQTPEDKAAALREACRAKPSEDTP